MIVFFPLAGLDWTLLFVMLQKTNAGYLFVSGWNLDLLSNAIAVLAVVPLLKGRFRGCLAGTFGWGCCDGLGYKKVMGQSFVSLADLHKELPGANRRGSLSLS